MSSKSRAWFGGALSLLLLVVFASCGNEAPQPTGPAVPGEDVTLAGKDTGTPAGPRTTDPVPKGWVSGGSPQAHDGFPTDLDFEGISAVCLDPVGEFYAGLGVHFSGADEVAQDGGCLNSFNYPPHSPVTVLAPTFGPSVIIDFDSPQTDVGIRYTSFSAITMDCFNSSAVLVGSDAGTVPNLDNFGGSIAPPNELLRVQGADIRQCVITSTAGLYTLDDLFADNLVVQDIIGQTCQGQAVTPGVTSFTFNGVTTIIGTDGSDVISGTDHIDVVIAKGGDDLICTFFGGDQIDGGPDNDTVFAGDQNDIIFGKEGRDILYGEEGNDRFDGGHTPVPSSLPDTQPDVCVGGGGRGDRFYLCETVFPGEITDEVLFGAAFIGSDGLATLYRIDPATGFAAAVGPIGFERVSAMDFHPQTGVLYATAERPGTSVPVLIRINPLTGAGVEVGPTGMPGQIGDASFRSDGTLFVIDVTNAPGHKLWTVNTTTGAGTLVGVIGIAGASGNGMTFDVFTTTLYHSDEDNTHTLDQATGAPTTLAPVSHPCGFGRAAAADQRPSDNVFYASRFCGDGSATLITLDYLTGFETAIGATTAGMDALAWSTGVGPI